MAKTKIKESNREEADEAWAVLAIDPGDIHCGMAIFEEGICTDAFEMSPHEMLQFVEHMLITQQLKALVVEQFRLYPWMAEQQAFSSFPTVERIGVLRWLWAKHGLVSEAGVKAGGRVGLAQEWVTWVENPATIKNPCRAILKARKIPQVSKRLKAGGHAADAELHGHYYLMHQQGQVPTYARGRDGNPAEVVITKHPKDTPKPAPVKEVATKTSAAAKKARPNSAAAKEVKKRQAARKVTPGGAKTAEQLLRPKRS